jgi:hypothetical protein
MRESQTPVSRSGTFALRLLHETGSRHHSGPDVPLASGDVVCPNVFPPHQGRPALLRLPAAGLLCHARNPRPAIVARHRCCDGIPKPSVRSGFNARGVDLARHRDGPIFRFRFRAAFGAGRAALHLALRPIDLILAT